MISATLQFSVLIPMLNGAAYLAKAMSSKLSQTLKGWELIDSTVLYQATGERWNAVCESTL